MKPEYVLLDKFNNDAAAIVGSYVQGWLDEMARFGCTNIVRGTTSGYYAAGELEFKGQTLHFEFAPFRYQGVYLSDLNMSNRNAVSKLGRRKFMSLKSMERILNQKL